MTRVGLVLAVLVLALASSAAWAQEAPVVARSTVDRQAMTIGDQALLTVTVDLAPGYDLLEPGVPRAVGDFEVVEILTALQTRAPDGAVRLQLRYLITAFELGTHRLPIIGVGYRGPDGALGEARTQGPLAIVIRSVAAPGEDMGEIKPLKPPLPVPGEANELVPRVLPFLAMGLLIAVAAALALRLRPRGPALVPVGLQGPARRALDELERVAELRLPEHGRTREHYDLVGAALRRFVAERFGLAAEARTARELRRELEGAGLDRAQGQLLFEVLADAEAIRYEDRVVYPARAQKAMREVIEAMRRSVVAEEYDLASSGATA